MAPWIVGLRGSSSSTWPPRYQRFFPPAWKEKWNWGGGPGVGARTPPGMGCRVVWFRQSCLEKAGVLFVAFITNRPRVHAGSHVAPVCAMYSASQVDVETVGAAFD